MNIPAVNNNVYVSNSRPSFGTGELYLPYGVSTANEMTRIDLNRKGRPKIYEIVENLKEKMPDKSYLSMDEHGISLIKSTTMKKGRGISTFNYGIVGPTIPFELNQSKNNLPKFYEKFEAACKQAIKEATEPKVKKLLLSFLSRK